MKRECLNLFLMVIVYCFLLFKVLIRFKDSSSSDTHFTVVIFCLSTDLKFYSLGDLLALLYGQNLLSSFFCGLAVLGRLLDFLVIDFLYELMRFFAKAMSEMAVFLAASGLWLEWRSEKWPYGLRSSKLTRPLCRDETVPLALSRSWLDLYLLDVLDGGERLRLIKGCNISDFCLC